MHMYACEMYLRRFESSPRTVRPQQMYASNYPKLERRAPDGHVDIDEGGHAKRRACSYEAVGQPAQAAEAGAAQIHAQLLAKLK